MSGSWFRTSASGQFKFSSTDTISNPEPEALKQYVAVFFHKLVH